MPPKMSNLSRHGYLQTIQYHYIRAPDRAAKARLLDSAQQTLQVGRKHLIRLLPGPARAVRPSRACLKERWIPSWERRH